MGKRGEWEGKGKKCKGGCKVLDSRMSQGPALQEPQAGGLPAFLRRRPGTIWVSVPRHARTFPPVGLKDFSPVMVPFK